MPSAFDADFAAADTLLAEVFGETVGIRRLGGATTSVTAQVMLTDYQVIDEDTGVPEIIQSRDYLITVADYVIAGSIAEPRAGDRLIQTINATECEFEAVPIGKRPAAEWADVPRTLWLIHTKQVK